MRRLSVLSLLVVALLLPLAATRSVPAQDAPAPAARTISIATLAPPGSVWMRVFEAWNREVRRRSNRTLQFRFYAGGVQGDEGEVVRKIRGGRIDAAAVTATGLGLIHRPALVFQLPGILRTYEQLDRARESLAPTIGPALDGAGFHLLGWADVGQARLFSTQPVRTPREIASRRPWVRRDDAILPVFYQSIGAQPVALQVPEVLGALQTNRIDTLIAPPAAVIALQWHAQLHHMLDMPLSIVIGATVIGKAQWDALTPEQQTILTETGTQFHTLARRNLRADETTGLRTLAERGIAVIESTEAERNQWRSTGADVRRRLAGQIADADLVARVSAFGN